LHLRVGTNGAHQKEHAGSEHHRDKRAALRHRVTSSWLGDLNCLDYHTVQIDAPENAIRHEAITQWPEELGFRLKPGVGANVSGHFASAGYLRSSSSACYLR
jgi:hypothetical protein